jgi:hypothetical protein
MKNTKIFKIIENNGRLLSINTKCNHRYIVIAHPDDFKEGDLLSQHDYYVDNDLTQLNKDKCDLYIRRNNHNLLPIVSFEKLQLLSNSFNIIVYRLFRGQIVETHKVEYIAANNKHYSNKKSMWIIDGNFYFTINEIRNGYSNIYQAILNQDLFMNSFDLPENRITVSDLVHNKEYLHISYYNRLNIVKIKCIFTDEITFPSYNSESKEFYVSISKKPNESHYNSFYRKLVDVSPLLRVQ